MKNTLRLAAVVILAALQGACTQATPAPTVETINPGDTIGDFLITTGPEAEDVLYSFDVSRSCTNQGEMSFSCTVSTGKYVNITTGLYDDTAYRATPTAKLNEDWAALNYKLFVADHPINLQAFGYVETVHPVRGIIRFWNVVVVTDKPGEITVRDAGVAGGKAFEGSTTYVFSEP